MRMAALMALVWAGCGEDPWNRMIRQPRVDAYETSALFPDGRAMRVPPPGTVPRELKLPSAEAVTGFVGGQPDAGYVQAIPLPLSEEMLRRGRRHFDVFCAACHGVAGNGVTVVARNMSLRPPPSLHGYVDVADGYLYQVVTNGFGLMPSYGQELELHDRWAVVAYVRALQLSQSFPLAESPPWVREQLERAP